MIDGHRDAVFKREMHVSAKVDSGIPKRGRVRH